jgi:hypothetical protein
VHLRIVVHNPPIKHKGPHPCPTCPPRRYRNRTWPVHAVASGAHAHHDVFLRHSLNFLVLILLFLALLFACPCCICRRDTKTPTYWHRRLCRPLALHLAIAHLPTSIARHADCHHDDNEPRARSICTSHLTRVRLGLLSRMVRTPFILGLRIAFLTLYILTLLPRLKVSVFLSAAYIQLPAQIHARARHRFSHAERPWLCLLHSFHRFVPILADYQGAVCSASP